MTTRPTLRRIFISYGHDEHVSLAIRLRDDLRTRGHYVWFDEERLQPGYDWEAFIETGLEHLAADKANSVVLLLLTPHSVRRPNGYCLNEIARALARGLRIIPLMVVESEPPLSICRIQWLDMRECIPIHEKETLYRPRFERLLKAIEDNQIDFEGTHQRLIKALQPLEFDADILRHVPKFTGRRWVFDRLDAWLSEDPPKQRVFWIRGGPAVGKTALSAVLSSRYLEVAALHLCKFGHAQKSEPRCVVISITYQLSTQLPEYEARLARMDLERLVSDDTGTMFDNLIVQPLATLKRPDRPIVILIDALDEASKGEKNELARFIRDEFEKTPPWVRLIVTSRPESAVSIPLQKYNPFLLDVEADANRADIRDFLRRELGSHLQSRPNVNQLLDQILDKSEGVFLYIDCVCDDLKCGNLSLERLEDFPQGLGGVFGKFFERQFTDEESYKKEIRPALRAILAAREPLPTEILQHLFGWQEEELHDFTRMLGSLFPVTIENATQVIKPFHKSLADWLTDKAKAGAYFVSELGGHTLLADFGWRKYLENARTLSTYFIAHLESHLANAGHNEQVAILLKDPQFLPVRVAVQIHSYYFNLARKEGWLYKAIDSSYEHLSEELQGLNRDSVYRILAILSCLNLKLVERTHGNSLPLEVFHEMIEANIEGLAEMEHNMWISQLGTKGWRYSEWRDDKRKLHSRLLAYGKMPEKEKSKTRDAVRRIPDIIAKAGLAVETIN